MTGRFVVVPAAGRPMVDDLPLSWRTAGGAPGGPARLCSPPGFSLWMAELDAGPGTTLAWDVPHGEQAVVVQEGSLEVDGAGAAKGSVVVLESHALPTVVAGPGGARLLAMGTTDPSPPQRGPFGPPRPGGAGTHVVGPGGVAGREGPPGKVTRYYATGCCPTCRVLLAWSARADRHAAAVHSHTQDELIHLVRGSIRVGSTTLEPGDTLAVPADTRYRFSTGDDGYGFLNYRPDATYYVTVDGTRLLEAGRGGDFAWHPDGAGYLSEPAWAAGPPAPSG